MNSEGNIIILNNNNDNDIGINNDELPEYVLSQELIGHNEMVRCLCKLSNGNIATGSRDNTTKIWEKDEFENREFHDSFTLVSHNSFVSAICEISPSLFLPQGGLATGSFDKSVALWELGEYKQPIQTFFEHTDVISSLSSSFDGYFLLSTSWDNTAKLRDIREGGSTVITCNEHTKAVWCSLFLPNENFVTGSADCSLIIWNFQGKIVRKIPSAHSDCIRKLVLYPDIGFFSSSNDGSIKLWDFNGNNLSMIPAHEEYVYSLTHIRSFEFATCGEDRTVKIWDGETNKQTIEHPGVVWDIITLNNGDIVTACSDSIARIFTRSSNRSAPPSLINKYEETISQYKLSRELSVTKDTTQPKLKIEEPIALQEKGAFDGDRKFIKEKGSSPAVYLWSEDEKKWALFGYLTEEQCEEIAGETADQHYDYTWPVEFDDGRKLTIGHNEGDNPWVSAYNFIEENKIPKHYSHEIAHFIINNLQSTPKSFSAASTNPSKEISILQNNQLEADYQTLNVSSPFLYSALPSLSAAMAKIVEFNSIDLIKNNQNWMLNDAEQGILRDLVSILQKVAFYHVNSFEKPHLVLLQKLLSWPVQYRFPLMDILRGFLFHPSSFDLLKSNRVSILSIFIKSLLVFSDNENDITNDKKNILVGFQAFSNSFNNKKSDSEKEDYRQKLKENYQVIFTAVRHYLDHPVNYLLAPSFVAISSFFLNFFIEMKNVIYGGEMESLNLISNIILNSPNEDCTFRSLSALGVLVANNTEIQNYLSKKSSSDVEKLHEKFQELYSKTKEGDSYYNVLRSLLKLLHLSF